MLNLVNANPSVGLEEVRLSLDEIARQGALSMLMKALQAEVSDYVTQFQDLRDEAGHRLVVRHGKESLDSRPKGGSKGSIQSAKGKVRVCSLCPTVKTSECESHPKPSFS
jgi:hypothetical protein